MLKNNQPSNLWKTVGEIYFSPRPKEHQFSTHVKFDARTPGGSHLFLRISPKDSPSLGDQTQVTANQKEFFGSTCFLRYGFCQIHFVPIFFPIFVPIFFAIFCGNFFFFFGAIYNELLKNMFF